MNKLVPQEVALGLLQQCLREAKIVAIDTETDFIEGQHRDIRDGTGKACGISLAWRDSGGISALFLPFNYPADNYNFREFHEVLQQILTKPIIFHNAKFDLVSISTLGLNTSQVRFFDTMIIAHLIDENNPVAGKGLDTLGKYYLKSEGKHIDAALKKVIKIYGWGGINPKILVDYAVQDAVLTLQLFEFLLPKLREENLQEMWKHKERFTRLVMGMEGRGVQLDQDLCREQQTIGEKRMVEVITELGGLNPSSPRDLYKLICVQLGLPEILNPKTGRRTFDKNAMEEYEIVLENIRNPTATRVLEYRGWQKTVSSNYISYLELVSPDGRLRPNYKLHGTRTGRLSCEKPNLQQIPRSSEKPWNGHLKKAFISPKGSTLIEFDYSQLELRLGTAYAKEPHLMEVFDQGRDIFTEMAERLGMARQDTKTMVYSIQYGAGVNRVSNALGIAPSIAKQRIDNYYATYPGFRRVSRQVETIVRKHGKVPLWSKRFRHFDFPESQGYKAFNSVIQGGAADIVERVMLKLDELNLPGTKMLLTVHDSVVFEVEDKYKEEVTPVIQRTMEDVNGATGQNFGVKFHVEGKEWK